MQQMQRNTLSYLVAHVFNPESSVRSATCIRVLGVSCYSFSQSLSDDELGRVPPLEVQRSHTTNGLHIGAVGIGGDANGECCKAACERTASEGLGSEWQVHAIGSRRRRAPRAHPAPRRAARLTCGVLSACAGAAPLARRQRPGNSEARLPEAMWAAIRPRLKSRTSQAEGTWAARSGRPAPGQAAPRPGWSAPTMRSSASVEGSRLRTPTKYAATVAKT